MQIVILCAGEGRRLGAGIPKCLVSINGVSILENIVRSITRINKLADIIVVTGFKSELVNQEVDRLRNTVHGFIQTVHNPNAQRFSIVRSMLVTLPLIYDEHVLRISGDVFFAKNNTLASLMYEKRTCIAIQPSPPFRDKTPLVDFTLNGQLIGIRLDTPSEQLDWEWADMEVYRNGDFKKLLSLGSNYESFGFYHFSLINNYLAQGMKIYCRGIEGAFEIDTPEDLDYVARNCS